MKSCGQGFLRVLTASWLTAATGGLLFLADYDSKPGFPARPPQLWPRGVSLSRNSSKPTLLMFLHPRCPCSRASLTELARLAYSEQGKFDLSVVFTHPSEVGENWCQTDIWENAIANPELHVVIDRGGVLASQFGTTTSGQVLIYDCQGLLQFSGGITPGRGHVGESFGHTIVRSIAAGEATATPVNCAAFGCSLQAASMPDDPYRSP